MLPVLFGIAFVFAIGVLVSPLAALPIALCVVLAVAVRFARARRAVAPMAAVPAFIGH